MPELGKQREARERRDRIVRLEGKDPGISPQSLRPVELDVEAIRKGQTERPRPASVVKTFETRMVDAVG